MKRQRRERAVLMLIAAVGVLALWLLRHCTAPCTSDPPFYLKDTLGDCSVVRERFE